MKYINIAMLVICMCLSMWLGWLMLYATWLVYGWQYYIWSGLTIAGTFVCMYNVFKDK